MPLPSDLTDRYVIERELGRGGMGTVYLARDRKLDRPVALKVLPPEFAGDSSLRERFLRETRTAASFSHPNIVPVHAVEDAGGTLAFAMGYVEGESLAEHVARRGPLDVRGIVRVLQDVGYALAYAHGRGVVHRDIKPDNIMIERATGRALLMDFGISRSMVASPAMAPGLTRVGEVVGTPEYMSPEQATGDTVDGRTDIYSLGLVALYALTGSKPISGSSAQNILAKQLTELPPPACSLRADLPESVGAAIDRCVRKQPEDRFPSAEALVEAIDAAQAAGPEIPLPVRLFAQELATLSLLIMFFVLMSPMLVNATSAGGRWDALIPLSIMAAVMFTRVALTFVAARRLVESGFHPDVILRGMQGVVDERSSLIAMYKANARVQARRRNTVRIARIMSVIAVVLIVFAISRGREIEPHKWRLGVLGLTAGITAFIMFGVSIMLFMKSPFRAPPAERILKRFWLGPVGRAFVRLAGRGVKADAGSSVSFAPAGPVSQSPPVQQAPVNTSGDRLAELEARLAALERNRTGQP
ncbi:MAG TPA: serine/threonine-protein kinase [Gemmatimonadaceae bacterium]|nr:serine/threonine-protein kinase [Gemmatimonadaceae bacterium]